MFLATHLRRAADIPNGRFKLCHDQLLGREQLIVRRCRNSLTPILVASTSFHFVSPFIYHRMKPALVLAVVSLATHFSYFSRAQDVGITTLSNWTQCSSICWCGKDNDGHVHARCSVRKLEKGVEFNLSRDLYALWVSNIHNLINEFFAFFTSGRRFHVATETTSGSRDLDR